MEVESLKARDAAKVIGVCKSTLDVSRVSGKLMGVEPPPYIRIGKSVRYRAADLRAWLQSMPSFTTIAEETHAKESVV